MKHFMISLHFDNLDKSEDSICIYGHFEIPFMPNDGERFVITIPSMNLDHVEYELDHKVWFLNEDHKKPNCVMLFLELVELENGEENMSIPF